MAYTKVASGITSVGQLKGILTQFGNKDNIFFTGCTGFSVAVNEETGDVLFDSDSYIEDLVSSDGLPQKQ